MRENQGKNRDRWQLSLCLLPVIGIIPALWNLSNSNSSTQQKKMSRLSLWLLLGWLSAYSGLWWGASFSSELLSLRLLYLNGILTTTYFLSCIFLMIRIWQRK